MPDLAPSATTPELKPVQQASPSKYVSPIYAHRLHRQVLFGIAPGLVAGAIAYVRTQRIAAALITAVSLLAASSVLGLHRYPLHLMPLARYLTSVLVPSVGIALAFGAAAVVDQPLAAFDGLSALCGAVVIGFASIWLDDRFQSDRPVSIAVIGSATFAGRLTDELLDNRISSYEVVGYLADESDGDPRARWLGSLDDVRDIVITEGVDLLVVSPQSQRLRVFEIAARACLDLPVRMIEATALYEDVLGHVPIGTINSAWFQFIMHPRYSPTSSWSKRGLDLAVSGALIVFLLPLLTLCALAVKLGDGGPVLYRQRRVGEEGREFWMMKFRTLVPDADDRFEMGDSEAELVTPVGRVLRKAHLNELPQLLQVARGDISLVGPRPEPPSVIESLSGRVPHYERRALVKPGLTGWAQVRCGYAANHSGSAWKTCHDLYYIKHRSARFDLLVLMQTVRALFESEEDLRVPDKDFILGEYTGLAAR